MSDMQMPEANVLHSPPLMANCRHVTQRLSNSGCVTPVWSEPVAPGSPRR